jgi:hypothetical protein
MSQDEQDKTPKPRTQLNDLPVPERELTEEDMEQVQGGTATTGDNPDNIGTKSDPPEALHYNKIKWI